MPTTHYDRDQYTDDINGDTPDYSEFSCFKPGQSIPWFARQKIDSDQTLLGQRYLCRGGNMLIIGPSGLGKSTLAIQISILWSIGKKALGIDSHKPRHILIVQAEDDQGDCTEMSAMINHLGLSPSDIELSEKNTEIVRCDDLTGKGFIAALKNYLEAASKAGHPFDLVVINPYSTYLGDDVKNAKANSEFLCNGLNPVLSDLGVGIVIIMHTPKTNFMNFDNLKPWDFQYAGAGSAKITDWARAILFMKPEACDDKLFLFVAAKRGRRIGWGTKERYFSHVDDDSEIIMWIDATEEQHAKASESRKDAQPKRKPATFEDVIAKCLSPIDWLSQTEIHVRATNEFKQYGLRRLEAELREFAENGRIERFFKKQSTGKALPQYRKSS